MNTTQYLTFVFFVQGEGRGHLTQAIAMKQLLEEAGHSVKAVFVGKSAFRIIPDFFYEKIAIKFYRYPSPNLLHNNDHKSIKIISSVIQALFRLPLYFKYFKVIHRILLKQNPQVVLNFYDPLIGVYYRLYKPNIQMIGVAHQNIYLHSDFKFPNGWLIKRILSKLLVRIATPNSCFKLALSWYSLPDLPKRKLLITPPLLRNEVINAQPSCQDYFLIYLLNYGYSDEIINWHKENKDYMLHCFWDKPNVANEYWYDKTLCFHRINDMKFISLLAGCKGFITTAGFEAISEAMFFNKPIMMVPVKNHFEQFCNSRDAYKYGLAIYSSTFNITLLIDYINQSLCLKNEYQWLKKSKQIMIDKINSIKNCE